MAAKSRKCDTIVVNELLAFVQNKLDVMDELSLEQICASSYTEAAILAAKKVLHDTAVTAVRLSTRRRDGNGKKDLRDIFRAFKETEPDDVPTYVVRDLNKLPPVTFDNVDVTSLLKDIQLMKANITDIQRKLEISEKTCSELRNEVTLLRNNAAPASPQSRAAGVQHDASPRVSTPTRATNTAQPAGIAPAAPPPARAPSSRPAPPPAPATAAARQEQESQRKASHRRRRAPSPAAPAPPAGAAPG